VIAAGTERQLHEAIQRQARHPAGRVAIALHLSRLTAPAPRPHHMRIARACLQDTASRHNGQVFGLANGDLVLLCEAGGPKSGARPESGLGTRATSADPAALPGVLQRLFRVDTPAPVTLVSVWPFETKTAEIVAYAAACLARAPQPGFTQPEIASQTTTLDAIEAVVGTSEISDILQRQTAVLLNGAPRRGEPGGLRPIYREVTFSIAALEARIASQGHVYDDPFLFRHLATRLDRRMLEVLSEQIGSGGPLDILAEPPSTRSGHGDGARPSATSLHVNLTVAGILSPAFERFALLCAHAASLQGRPRGLLGVEINLMEAMADPTGFASARAAVTRAGFTLLLDGVSHLALALCQPTALQPDILKLDWSPRLSELAQSEADAIDDTIAAFGPQRIVLQRAETEAALRWGLSRGIRRFQGRHVDAMLGAARIVACRQAEACTLRQCIERSSATGTAGRTGCTNLRLLDEVNPAPIGGEARPSQVPAQHAERPDVARRTARPFSRPNARPADILS
jgi:hypothetical protein